MVERGWAASRPTADVKKSITLVDLDRPLLVSDDSFILLRLNIRQAKL
jgi:hypothetical protein